MAGSSHCEPAPAFAVSQFWRENAVILKGRRVAQKKDGPFCKESGRLSTKLKNPVYEMAVRRQSHPGKIHCQYGG
jgi:hypothetical protein